MVPLMLNLKDKMSLLNQLIFRDIRCSGKKCDCLNYFNRLEEEEKLVNAENCYKKALNLDETFSEAEEALQKLRKHMQVIYLVQYNTYRKLLPLFFCQIDSELRLDTLLYQIKQMACSCKMYVVTFQHGMVRYCPSITT